MQGHASSLSENLNPDFAWADVPVRHALIRAVCHDPDVPSKG
jgi:phosphatidylethanolamine-binding protein (PEBP) family uncharacterized protein